MDRLTTLVTLMLLNLCLIKEAASGGGSHDRSGRPYYCVSSCQGRPNRHYPSCFGCELYASCSDEILYDGNKCDEGMLWSPVRQACDWPAYVTCAVGSRRPQDVPEPGAEPPPGPNDDNSKEDPDSSPDSTEPQAAPFETRSNSTDSNEDSSESDLELCLVWLILCAIAVALLFILSMYMLCTSWFGFKCGRNKKTTVDMYVQFPDNLSIPSYADATAPDYDMPRYVTAPPLPARDDADYQEIFPIYEELSRYRDTYLELHGYTYLQLVDHARNEVVRRDIARSVGPLYLTLCHLEETSPKAYESTHDRMKALVQQVWQEISPSAVVNIPSGKVKKF